MKALVAAAAAIIAALVLAPAALAAPPITVTSGADGGGVCPSPNNCTLRDAIAAAQMAPSADTIDFDPSVSTVTISSAPLAVASAITVDGGGGVTVAEDPAYTGGPLFSFQTGSIGSTLENITLAGPGAAGATSLVEVAVPNVTIASSTLRDARTSGVSLISGGQQVTITRSPIYRFGTKAISFDASGVNGGIAAPTLQVGPRQANGTLPITGTTGPGGTLELFRGDPAVSDGFWFDATVPGGAFSVVPPAEPMPGEKVSATITDPSHDTSELVTTTVPSDVVSPWIANAVATSFNEIRVQPSEPIDPASIQPSDFAVHMAGVDRPIAGASASPDGSSITLYSPNGWGPGDAGMVHLTAAGAIADPSGNMSLTTSDVHVGGAPGDFVPPVVTNFRLSPASRLCILPKPRCRTNGAKIIFRSSEDGFAWITVLRGTKLIGTRKYIAQPGDNLIHFDGKIRGRRLAPGLYRMYVGVQDTFGNLTAAANQPSRTFSIAKPKKRRR
jgi:CSLREA domain-containing protein